MHYLTASACPVPQREVSRAITPAIQEQMRPAYQRASEESGPGSHARRKARLPCLVQPLTLEGAP